MAIAHQQKSNKTGFTSLMRDPAFPHAKSFARGGTLIYAYFLLYTQSIRGTAKLLEIQRKHFLDIQEPHGHRSKIPDFNPKQRAAQNIAEVSFFHQKLYAVTILPHS